MTFPGYFSPYIEVGELAAVGRGGWAGHTAVGCGDLACRRSARWFDSNHHGPQRLTSEPVGGLRATSEPPWATTNGCQKCKIFKLSYFCKMILKNIKNPNSKLCAHLQLAMEMSRVGCGWSKSHPLWHPSHLSTPTHYYTHGWNFTPTPAGHPAGVGHPLGPSQYITDMNMTTLYQAI
jgi:hypothetical protein